jgi:hypothetical protein
MSRGSRWSEVLEAASPLLAAPPALVCARGARVAASAGHLVCPALLRREPPRGAALARRPTRQVGRVHGRDQGAGEAPNGGGDVEALLVAILPLQPVRAYCGNNTHGRAYGFFPRRGAIWRSSGTPHLKLGYVGAAQPKPRERQDR